MKGTLEVITGCMYSGKTRELLERLDRSDIRGMNSVLFKPKIDNRYSTSCVVSHKGHERDSVVVNTETPEFISEYVEKHAKDGVDVIGIDEVNLFDENVVKVCNELADQGHRVIVSGLDTNFRGEPFEPMPYLMATSDTLDKLKAVCENCGDTATKVQRINENGEPAHYDEPEEKIGGEDIYEARCRSCHNVRRD